MNEPSIYMLCVGINEYKFIHPLGCASRDAQDMADLFGQNRGSFVDVEILLNAHANKLAILEKLAWLAQNAGVNDTAILFFTGHGLQQIYASQTDAYLCPAEASLTAVKQTCIHSDELTVALRAIRAGRLVVLLDTCHAGAIGEPRNLNSHVQLGLPIQKMANTIEGSGRVILGACRPNENAWEINGMRNGLFTHYLLEGLRGGAAHNDGTIWMSDLFSYVSRLVRQKQFQVPYQKAIGEDFIILSGVPASNQIVMPSQHLSAHVNSRVLRKAMCSAYNRSELALLCKDLGLSLENLTGENKSLETQMLDLIDYCNRHSRYIQLVDQVLSERPHLRISLLHSIPQTDS